MSQNQISNNPWDLVSMLKNGANPQQVALRILENRAKDNPFIANLIELANENKIDDLEQIVRNAYTEKGMNYDETSKNLKQMLGFK